MTARPALLPTFPPEARFCYGWRGYQQRVLNELDQHLANGHLHVVAPPGSGKTVLGLEVMRRLDRPTLILAPTLAIRNQWTQRWCELFLQTPDRPAWISHDIRRPGRLTVCTYQGLHAACTGQPAETENPPAPDDEAETEAADVPAAPLPGAGAVLAALRACGVATLVLDEAHHLQNAWWKSLMLVKEALAPTTVSLTATPPYDISTAEWQRYCTISGPVDAEIAVPELLAVGDLCPHQDYVCCSTPTHTEGQRLGELHTLLQTTYATLRHDPTLLAALAQHPIITQPDAQLDWVYNNLPAYAASLIVLHANGRPLSAGHLAVLGNPSRPDEPVPPLTPEWLETALEFYLFAKEGFEDFAELRRTLEKQLRQQGLLERRRVHLRHHPHLSDYLSTSLSKLQSIGRIVEFEHQRLGQHLRLVVLTDYIRKEFLGLSPDNNLPLSKMGVLPIFETLRRANPAGIRLGVLTGSLVLVPAAALPALRAAAQPLTVAAEPLPADPSYVVVQATAGLQPELVRLTTHLFEQGHIEVLVGTKSLLGEGWDAPGINALVLASFVGSFVLSNQMRGRAIRTQAGNAAKTSNIWHLACLDLLALDGGADLALLRRRFSTFVGVSLPPQEIRIENNLARLGVPAQLASPTDMEALNNSMFAAAADRAGLLARWQQALAGGRQLRLEIRQPPTLREPLTRPLPEVRQRYYNRSLAYLLAELLTALTWFGLESFESFVQQLVRGSGLSGVLLALKLTLLAGLVYFGRRAWHLFGLYAAYRDIALDLENIGKALLNSLLQAGAVQPGPDLRVVATAAPDGSLSCYLTGGSTFEHAAFVRAMQEILQPIDNPRYVVMRQSKLFRLFEQRDYHAVPEELGRSRQLAESFAAQWQEHVGRCDLIFTRTLAGRQQLLQARTHALSTVLYPRAEPVSRWQ